ncbi:hypothetical protein ILYODFUR_024243 [Ilyodon furcidens]|uniref:Uncharacterized protein n=1 Tax=Ilyodon furcidens TaxID=33524 RepID=A0ABV0U8P6_9TELE
MTGPHKLLTFTFSFKENVKVRIQITAGCPGAEVSKQPQTITLTPPCLNVCMMFFFLNFCHFSTGSIWPDLAPLGSLREHLDYCYFSTGTYCFGTSFLAGLS